RPAVANCLPSGLKATPNTPLPCPRSVRAGVSAASVAAAFLTFSCPLAVRLRINRAANPHVSRVFMRSIICPLLRSRHIGQPVVSQIAHDGAQSISNCNRRANTDWDEGVVGHKMCLKFVGRR